MTLDRPSPFGWSASRDDCGHPATLFQHLAASQLADGVNTGYFGNVAIGLRPSRLFHRWPAQRKVRRRSARLGSAPPGISPNAKHRDAFAAEPIPLRPPVWRFLRAGDGRDEASANIDPEAWRIVDGKLYLFSGKEGLEEDFDACAAEMIAQGRRQVAGGPAEGIQRGKGN